jgi:hypothetical protein
MQEILAHVSYAAFIVHKLSGEGNGKPLLNKNCCVGNTL